MTQISWATTRSAARRAVLLLSLLAASKIAPDLRSQKIHVTYPTEMFLRSNIDDYDFSIPPMQIFRSLILIGIPAFRYVHQYYMQYFSKSEFSPKQLPYQLRQLAGR